jgi:NAD(P)H-flavin reductase
MYRIKSRNDYSDETFVWEVEAPDIAQAARPGHFVIVKHTEGGERVPFTIADYDPGAGTITLVIQAVGTTTQMLRDLRAGEFVDSVAGPLGQAPRLSLHEKKVVCVGGGLGVAALFPQLRALKALGNEVVAVVGFRSREFIFWERRLGEHSDELLVATNDGSYGRKGLVTQVLREVLDREKDVSEVIAIGPLGMMKAACDVTRACAIRTCVSLNPIMIDGTGMCGGCRATVDKKIRFACVDGPHFDGHRVDFDELMLRDARFGHFELQALRRSQKQNREKCRIGTSSSKEAR